MRHYTFTIKDFLRNFNELKSTLEEAGFKVTHSGLTNINKINSFIESIEKEEDDTRRLTESECRVIEQFMGSIENMLFSEALTKKIYVVDQRKYSIDVLTEHPEKMFNKNIYDKLPPIAKTDIEESFHAIVFSMATASAFHILRATEAVLLSYYKNIIKKGREKVPMWGNMTEGLRKRRGSDKKLLDRLDYIRNNYRNPTTHPNPEAHYTIETAQDLLGICIDVINTMGKSLA